MAILILVASASSEKQDWRGQPISSSSSSIASFVKSPILIHSIRSLIAALVCCNTSRYSSQSHGWTSPGFNCHCNRSPTVSRDVLTSTWSIALRWIPHCRWAWLPKSTLKDNAFAIAGSVKCSQSKPTKSLKQLPSYMERQSRRRTFFLKPFFLQPNVCCSCIRRKLEVIKWELWSFYFLFSLMQ